MAYQLGFSSIAIRADALESGVRDYVDLLAAEPRPPGARRVSDSGRFELWRLRTSGVRVLYRIDERAKTVTIIGVTRRTDPYSL